MAFTQEQRSIVEEYMSDNDIPGAAVALVRDGEIITEGGFGVADVSARRPATEHTVWPICSLTKSLTGTAVMQLSERGRLLLDEPVQTYLPAFRLKDEAARMFLRHSSGMGRTGHQDQLREAPVNPYPTRASLVRALKGVGLQSPPDACWSYSNEGYAVLGHLIETISGTPLEEYFQREVFDRAGMGDSFVRFADWRAAADRAYPYARGDVGPFDSGERHDDYVVTRLPEDYQTFLSTGGVASSAHDLAKYQLAAMDYDRSPLLSGGSLDQMHSPSFQYGDTGWGYGFGWQVFWARGQRVVGHGGGLPGISNYSLMFPARRTGAVVLTNRGARTAFLLAERLMGTMLGTALFRDSQNDPLPFRSRHPSPSGETLDEYAGSYAFNEVAAEVSPWEMGLSIRLPGRRDAPDQAILTVAVAPDTFLDRNLASVIHFVRGAGGRVRQMLHGGYAYRAE